MAWLVIALTDRGQHDHPDPERSRITFQILNGPSVARGVLWPSPTIVDPCATVLTQFILNSTVVTGMNDASADNLAFVLVANPDPGIQIVSYGFVGDGWQLAVSSRSDRRYSIERSEDLTTWTEIVAPLAGTGEPLTLTDPEPPAVRAFYRVVCWWP